MSVCCLLEGEVVVVNTIGPSVNTLLIEVEVKLLSVMNLYIPCMFHGFINLPMLPL